MARTGHPAKMARRADAAGHPPAASRGAMHAEVIRGITIRPLRSGESSVIQAVFDRLGPPPPAPVRRCEERADRRDLEQLSRVDGDHHVLVAVVDGEPVGIARLVRTAPWPKWRSRRRRLAAPRRRHVPRRSPGRGCARSGHRATARDDACREPRVDGADVAHGARAEDALRRRPARSRRPRALSWARSRCACASARRRRGARARR